MRALLQNMQSLITYARRILTDPLAVLVIDIDGTLGVDTHRAHLRPGSHAAVPHCLSDVPREEIDRYMAPALLAKDEPIRGAERFLKSLLPANHVVFATARWESRRHVTAQWLIEHYEFLFSSEGQRWRDVSLLMRPDDDIRASVDVKTELVGTYYDKFLRGLGLRPLLTRLRGVWIDDDRSMLHTAAFAGFVPFLAPACYRED